MINIKPQAVASQLCGPFALALMIDILEAKLNSKLLQTYEYKQPEMRNHIVFCLKAMHWSLFPRISDSGTALEIENRI